MCSARSCARSRSACARCASSARARGRRTTSSACNSEPDVFCPDCGTWNRARAVTCMRCSVGLPDIADVPRERPDEELTALRRLTGSRYRVLRRLGSGGMANVYYAEHQLLERPLVIKVLHAHLAKDAEMRERFRREAEAAS